jgi:cell division protein FtsL
MPYRKRYQRKKLSWVSVFVALVFAFCLFIVTYAGYEVTKETIELDQKDGHALD